MYLLMTWTAPARSQRRSGPPAGEDLGAMLWAVGETVV